MPLYPGGECPLADKNRPENPRKTRYRTRYRILRRQPLKFDKSLCSGQPVGLPERHGSARKIIVDRTRTETGYFGDGLGACDALCGRSEERRVGEECVRTGWFGWSTWS